MAAINLAALAAELTNDPAALGYAGKTTDEIYALLQTPEAVECFVSLKDLQSKLMETVVAPAQVPVWWVLKGAAASNPLAGMVFDLFSPAASRLENFNTRGAFQQQALGQLLAAGLIDRVRDRPGADRRLTWTSATSARATPPWSIRSARASGTDSTSSGSTVA